MLDGSGGPTSIGLLKGGSARRPAGGQGRAGAKRFVLAEAAGIARVLTVGEHQRPCGRNHGGLAVRGPARRPAGRRS